MFIKKLSAKLSFFTLVALAAAIVTAGCGSLDGQSPADGIISGGEDTIGKTPEVAIVRTSTTVAGETKVSYHFETDMELSVRLVVGLEIKTGDKVENAIVILEEGTSKSDAHSFGESISSVRILQHKDLIDFGTQTVAAINLSEELSVDFAKYPVHQRPYSVSSDDSSVSR